MAPRTRATEGPRDSEPDSDADPAAGDTTSNDDNLGRGVEHLQVAAHEMLAAARSFLDVVEDVVSDRDKLSGVAATVTELLGSAGGSLARLADRVAGATPSPGASADPADGGAAPTGRPRVRRIDVD